MIYYQFNRQEFLQKAEKDILKKKQLSIIRKAKKQ